MLKTLTNTSQARGDVDAAELERILRSAMTLNPLDGITGLLIFNGRAFMQIVEGAPEAIDDLVERLQVDPRHADFRVRDERMVEQRSFPDWTMTMVRVSIGRFEARNDIERVLPPSVSPEMRTLVMDMADLISN